MPIYEYQCTACDTIRDIKHGFKETTGEVCLACGAPLKRVFRPAGIVFKGSGFYVTDSRKSAETSAEKTAEKSAEKPAKTDATPGKTDATPAKTESAPAASDGGSKAEPAKPPASPGKSDAAA